MTSQRQQQFAELQLTDLLSDAVSVSASFHASFELQCLCPLKHMCVQVSESENSGLLSL